MSRVLLLLGLMVATRSVFSARILAAMPTFGRSHQFAFQPYLEALAKQGHKVTFLTFFPIKEPIPNLTQVDVSEAFDVTELISSITVTEKRFTLPPIFGMFFIAQFGKMMCDAVLQHPDVQTLIQSEQKFDLVITELFITDCFDAFAHKFQAPLIIMSASTIMPWAEAQGNPTNPSYISTISLGYTNSMSLYQRVMNSMFYVYMNIFHKLFAEMRQTSLARQYFGESLPTLSEITRKASVLFLNTHFSVHGARPLVPGTVEIGGIHIRPPKKLPKDIQQFLDESKEGVVYFSMGSNLRSTSFSVEKRQAFLEAFAKIPQRVLWKYENDSLPGQPKNVMIGKWMPQNEILGHPNVRAFISHGGLLGTTEAVHNGVPMIGIPVMADQVMNVKNIESAGMGILLHYADITKERVEAVLSAVLTNPSYRNNATRLSGEFKDRPLPPLETALYWTEYVLRHNGAPQLRTAAMDLAWYQYLLLDVAAVILVTIVVVVLVIRRLCLLCCAKKTPAVDSKKKRN